MPGLAILRAAAQVGLGIYHAVLEHEEAVGRERGGQRAVEASVAVEIDGILAVALSAFLVGQEHRYLCAVGRGIEHLLGDILVEVDTLELGTEHLGALAGLVVIGIYGRGRCKGAEAVIHVLGMCARCREGERAYAGQLDVGLLLAVERVDGHMVGGVLLIGHIHVLAREAHILEHAVRLGDEFAPVLARGVGHVGHHYAFVGRTEGGEDIYFAVDYVDDVAVILLVGRHSDPRASAAHLDSVAHALARNVDKHRRVGVGHARAVEVERIGGVGEYESVIALRGAELVIVDLMVLVGVGELLAGLGARIRAVIEAVAVPFGTCELGPLYVVGEQFFGGSVHHVYLHPVTAAAVDGIGCIFAIL